MNLEILSIDEAIEHWDGITAFLLPAMNPEQDAPTFDDIKAGVTAGTVLVLMMSADNVLHVLSTIELSDGHRGRTITIQTLAGADIKPCLAQYMQYIDTLAAQEQVGRIIVTGRSGWARYLKHHGYVEVTRTLVKTIEMENTKCQVA